MGIYTRYKRSPDGLRQLVELLEQKTGSKRQVLVDAGMNEDPDYTQLALQYVISFADVEGLNDMELAEVLSSTPAPVIGIAFSRSSAEVKQRVIKCANPRSAAEFKDSLENPDEKAPIGGAQLKLIASMRKLEKKGIVKVKRVPS